MKFNCGLLLSFFFLASIGSSSLQAKVHLPAFVNHGMVLQRNEPIMIWGWANPGEQVKVHFIKKKYSTITTPDGKWQVKLKPQKAGGPYTMIISGENKITIDDILIGDVWVCSGQSNMTHHFNRHQERYAKEIANSENDAIRQLYVPTRPLLGGPQDNFPGLEWKKANPVNLLDFTVVGYFFAKKLYAEYQIPIGIINTAVGGTPIEAWTSEQGFSEFPELLKEVKLLQDSAYVNQKNRDARADRAKNEQRKLKDKGMLAEVKWYDQAYQPMNWKRIAIPGYWEDQGVRNFDGVMWYRKVIDIPATMTNVNALIKMGRIIDADELYINGQKVGGTGYQYPQREYSLDPDVLKPGKNVFVMRITNNFGKGGCVPDKPYLLLAAGDTIDLKGYWEYKVGEVFRHDKEYKQGINAQNAPTALFNGMIAPFTKYAVKGCLWYQGESNSGEPEKYAKLLPNLIDDWRNQWHNDELAFLIAQLPNFMDVNYLPEESNWAEMREVQLQTSKNTPHTGLAVNIDLGEWNDIHPGNKKPVGERMALTAMRITYGDYSTVTSGPTVESYRREKNKIIITFNNTGSGLVCNNNEPLDHFAIAGEDGKFFWANATINENEVIVWSENVSVPKEIRYAWADNPDFANLYNAEGLPASPFKIEIK